MKEPTLSEQVFCCCSLLCLGCQNLDTDNQCTTENGYYYFEGRRRRCDAACSTCFGGYLSNCLSCSNLIQNLVYEKFECVCEQGYYYNQDEEACVNRCHNKCEYCKKYYDSCTVCKFASPRDIENDCECLDGYYEKSDDCWQCNPKCATCENAKECLDCAEKRSGEKCECDERYYEEDYQCKACHYSCRNCYGKEVN